MFHVKHPLEGKINATQTGFLVDVLREKYRFDVDIFTQNLLQYERLLLERNKITQLVSRKDEAVFFERHVCECYAPALAYDFTSIRTVLDLGTGAGLPGMLLAFLCPETQFYLVDSKLRRIDFLNNVLTALNIQNVKTFRSRVEDLKFGKFANDTVVIARAVSSLQKLWSWSLSLFEKNACTLLAMKGGNLVDETKNVQRNFRAIGVERLNYDSRLVNVDAQRCLVKITAKG